MNSGAPKKFHGRTLAVPCPDLPDLQFFSEHFSEGKTEDFFREHFREGKTDDFFREIFREKKS